MIETELLIQKEVIKALNAPLLTEISFNHFIRKLEGHINHLIENNFQKLVSVLYKLI